ncbi:MAG: DMT family transporter [Bacillota bacterium]|nr:DMT family transporter [Bacillota bacterium]
MVSKRTSYILMVLLVFIWGMEYIVAKHAMEVLDVFTMLFYKCFIGLLVLLAIKLFRDRRFPWDKKDLLRLVLSAVFGEVLYFACEYQALDYLPVAMITIVLAFVPAVSVLIERAVYKKPLTGKTLLGVAFCVLGVVLVIGPDFQSMGGGRLFGYVLVVGAVFCWNAYNFLTAGLGDKYDVVSLSCYQLAISAAFLVPLAGSGIWDTSVMTPLVVVELFYMGVVNTAGGFLIYVSSIRNLGATPCALYSNFLPITSTFFGWVILKESITLLQALGGAVVIASACAVILEREKINKALSGEGLPSSGNSDV